MSGRANMLRVKLIRVLRRAIYKPVDVYPSPALIRVVVRLDKPLRQLILARDGVLDSN